MLDELETGMMVPAQDEDDLRGQMMLITDTVLRLGDLVKKMYGDIKEREKAEIAEFRSQRRAALEKFRRV